MTNRGCSSVSKCKQPTVSLKSAYTCGVCVCARVCLKLFQTVTPSQKHSLSQKREKKMNLKATGCAPIRNLEGYKCYYCLKWQGWPTLVLETPWCHLDSICVFALGWNKSLHTTALHDLELPTAELRAGFPWPWDCKLYFWPLSSYEKWWKEKERDVGGMRSGMFASWEGQTGGYSTIIILTGCHCSLLNIRSITGND